MLLLPRVWIQSLVGEPRSHKLLSETKKQDKQLKNINSGWKDYGILWNKFRGSDEEKNKLSISLYKYFLGSASRKKKIEMKEDLGSDGELYVEEKVSLSEKSTLQLARKVIS